MGDSYIESTVSSKKYLDLAFEYSKLKDKFKQLGVLGQRIIGEKESAVADAVQIDRQLRQSTQENENLKFHNNQLSVRVNLLQEELKSLRQKQQLQQNRLNRSDVRSSRVFSTTVENPSRFEVNAASNQQHVRCSSSTGFGDHTSQSQIYNSNLYQSNIYPSETYNSNMYDSNIINEGINTFVEATKNQVASMANENEQLVQTIQTMRNEFDMDINEKNSEINSLRSKIEEVEKHNVVSAPSNISHFNQNNSNKDNFSKNNNVVSSLYRKVSSNSHFFNRKPNQEDTVSQTASQQTLYDPTAITNSNVESSSCQLFNPQYSGLDFHLVPSRISRKIIKSNERVIVSCLESFVDVLRNMCTDVSETIRNSSQSTTHSGLQYYDFSTSLSLIQMASSSMKEYEGLVAFHQNRFQLIYGVINKCCTALAMIEKLLEFHFNYLLNPTDTINTTSNTLIDNNLPSYKLHLLQILQKYLSILAATFKNLYTPYTPPKCSINGQSKLIIFNEIKNTLQLFVTDLNAILHSVVIDNNNLNSSHTVSNHLNNVAINENITNDLDNVSNQQLYLTLNSLLKTRSTQLIDVINMFTLVIESESDMLEKYGWFSSHMVPLDQSNFVLSNDDDIRYQGAFQKITHFMNATNNQLKTAHLTNIERLIPSTAFNYSVCSPVSNVVKGGLENLSDFNRADKNDTHFGLKSLKEKYLQLQQQLIATIKKLDGVTNTNELLQFKLKTISTIEQANTTTSRGSNVSQNVSYVVSDQILPSNQVLDELKNYTQERICIYQGEHRRILSHICVLLSDWQAMKYRLEECQKSLKSVSNEATRYKNEHASLSTHLMSVKESYEKNVVELTEKLSLKMSSQGSGSSKIKK